MEIDIDLNVRLPRWEARGLELLPPNYTVRIEENGSAVRARIEYADRRSLATQKDISQTINEFLEGLDGILVGFKNGELGTRNGTLRIGIYYDTNDQVTVSVGLSQSCLQRLAALGFALDMTAYPCSD
jgi:hypothetical protein